MVKFTETGSGMVVPGGWEEGEMGNYCLLGMVVNSFWDDEVLGTGSGDSECI